MKEPGRRRAKKSATCDPLSEGMAEDYCLPAKNVILRICYKMVSFAVNSTAVVCKGYSTRQTDGGVSLKSGHLPISCSDDIEHLAAAESITLAKACTC